MAVSSMTGFGRWETRISGLSLTVEIRSVNHRYFETSLRLPGALASFEEEIRGILQSSLDRGRVSVTIEMSGGDERERYVPDPERVKAYVSLARDLVKKHGLPGGLDVATLLQLPDVLVRRTAEVEGAQLWPHVEKGVRKALREMMQMRRREGRTLAADLRKRLAGIRKGLTRVEKMAARRAPAAARELRRRLEKLLGDVPLNEDRVAQEAAALADRLDCTEEIVRARSHVDQFLRFLSEGGAVGRKLNFLLQELHREVNTVGSKANDAAISREVVLLKEEVERLREQVQNLE